MTREHNIDWDDARVARLWDYYSRTSPYSNMYFSKIFGEQIIRKACKSLGDPLRVLDMGCGPGFIWEHLRLLESEWFYTGLDFSQKSVDKLSEKAKGHTKFGGAIRVERFPAELPHSQFDIVLLIEVVEHLKDEYLESTLKEAKRVLKPGGLLLITTPNDEDLSLATKYCPDCECVFHEWQHIRSWTPESLSNLVGRHGFRTSFISTLDFGATGLLGWCIRTIKRLLKRGSLKPPHLFATFNKM